MKKTILIILTALICKFAFSQTVKNVIHYEVNENGKVILTLKEGEGYLYKPLQEKAYYLYSNADYIYFDIAGDEVSDKKKIELKNAKKGDFWPMMENDNGTPTECKYEKQPFSTINKNNISLFRNSLRPTVMVKDEFLIDGQMVYVWAPERGYVDFTVGDTTVTQDARIVIKKETSLSIHGNKHGRRAILKGILINGKEVPTRTDLTGRIDNIPPSDAFDQSNSVIYLQKDTTVTREAKSFTVSLLYDYLDENYNLCEGCTTVKVDVDIKRHGIPAGVWILVIIGGAILILLIIGWGIRAGKRKSKKNLISNNNPSENTDNKPKDVSKDEPPVITPQEQTGEVPQQGENKDDKGGKIADTDTGQGEELRPGDSTARIAELSAKLQQQEQQLTKLDSNIKSYQTKLKEQNEALDQKKRKIESIQKELNIANSNVEKYKHGKDEAEKEANELSNILAEKKQDLEKEKEDHNKTKGLLAAAEAKASAQIEIIKKKCEEEIETAKKDCTKQIEAQKELYTTEIKQIQESCESRLVNWRADKDAFLTGICKPVERLYQISDDISNDLEDSAKDLTEYLDYIVSSLREFSERVQNKSGEDGEWKNGTNAEAEKAIQKDLVDLIRNNSSWINAIARLYCYSRVKAIGQSFEENGMKVAAIDSTYRDMVSFLGRYGITVIVPRILVDYYDDISRKYFGFNNEDNAISRFVSRGVLIQNQDTLKIYDMGRIAYYLDGKITKGEIVHF